MPRMFSAQAAAQSVHLGSVTSPTCGAANVISRHIGVQPSAA